MESRLTKDMIILVSRCDSSARLGVSDAFELFMDMAAEHAESLGNGAPDMMARGLFWVVVKTKLRFYRRPGLMERVAAATWPEAPGRFRGDRDYVLTAGDGTLLSAGKTEWAILDTVNGGLHSVREGIYAPDMVFDGARALPEPFHRFREGEWTPFGGYTVRSTDIDMAGHMNNAAYVRMLEGLFSASKWNALDVSEAEVHYRSSCYEGDALTLFRRDGGDGAMEFKAEAPDGRTVILARLK